MEDAFVCKEMGNVEISLAICDKKLRLCGTKSEGILIHLQLLGWGMQYKMPLPCDFDYHKSVQPQ